MKQRAIRKAGKIIDLFRGPGGTYRPPGGGWMNAVIVMAATILSVALTTDFTAAETLAELVYEFEGLEGML